MTLTASEVFRDFVTDGVPSSGAWKPLKKEIRALLAAMATGGATGLYDFIPASNVGAGTANAIKADTAVALPATPNGALVAVNVYADNTASPVTVQFNGGTVYTVKTNSGNDVAPGGLKAGMVAAGYISGTTFRLLSDQASAAIQAAAEAAQEAAEAAQAAAEAAATVASGAMTTVIDPQFATKATAEAFSPVLAPDYIRTAGYSAAGDGGGALYKKVASEPSHDGKLSITLSDGTTVVWYEVSDNLPPVGALGLLPGNSEAANAAALADLDGVPRAAFELGGDVDLPANTYPSKLLVGNGTIFKGGEPFPFNAPGQSARDYLHRLFGRIGNLDTFVKGLRNGSPKIAFVGDSITEGLSNIDYEDSWAGLLEAEFRRRWPMVTWEFANFSIAGRGVGELGSDTYVGAANAGAVVPGATFWQADGDYRVPQNNSLWPGGTTAGKSWLNHVRDWGADIVLIAVGMNTGPDGATTVKDNALGLKTNVLANRVNTWTKVPTVALVAPMIPTRDPLSPGSKWDTVQGIADAWRGVAEEFNYTLLDANALSRSYLDGLDVTRTRRVVVSNFADYANWVTLAGDRPDVAGNVMTFSTAGWVYSPDAVLDGDWSYDVMMAGADNVLDLVFRADPSAPGTAYLFRLRRVSGAPSWVLYYGATALASGGLPEPGDGIFHIRVKVRGARQDAWINGIKVVLGSALSGEVQEYNWLKKGYYGLSASGSATISNFVARLGYPAVIGHPIFREEDLLGTDDFGVSRFSLGGSGVNHPSILGHRALYFDACAPLLRAVEMELAKAPPSAVVLEASSTAASILPDDYISAGIDSTYSPQVSYVGGSATDNTAVSFHAAKLTGVSSCTVSLRKNGVSDQILETLTLPYTANWLIEVRCVASFNDPNARASLVATAIEVR